MDRDDTKTWRNWAPGVFIVLLLGVLTIGTVIGFKTLFRPKNLPAAEPPQRLVIEEYVPLDESEPVEEVELDRYGNPIPQRVEVPESPYPEPEHGCGTEALPRLNPFCDNLSDRALTDRHVAQYMSYLAVGVVAPGTLDAWPMSKDITHWLRAVVGTPVEDGGPDLENRAEYLSILDRWHSDDFSTAKSRVLMFLFSN